MNSRPDLLLALDAVVPSNNSIEKIYGLMLYGAVKHQQPDVVLELGTAQGYSTAWMLLALEENEKGHLWAIDLVAADNPVWKQVGIPTTRLTYCSNDFIDSMREKLPPVFDLVFHDAGHNVAEVEKDLAWVLPRLSVGGSLVVHDTVYNPQIGERLTAFFEHPVRAENWKWEQITEASGVGIATRVKIGENECKEKSSGSTTEKGLDLSKGKMGGTISPTSAKLTGSGTRRSRKTKLLYSSRLTRKRDPARKSFASNGIK